MANNEVRLTKHAGYPKHLLIYYPNYMTADCGIFTALKKRSYFFRLSVSGRYAKSPDLIETTFSMTTIEEEQEIALSLKNLSA